MTNFNLEHSERIKLLQFTIDRLEKYYENTKSYRVSPSLDIAEITSHVKKTDFNIPISPEQAITDVIEGLQKFSVHTPHPNYFGLFNPRTNFSSIIADFITAVFNPQLAAWSHAPYAVEVENYLISEFGKKFGYKPDNIDGVFTTGGAEANLTALLCALNHSFSDFAQNGLLGFTKRPMIYCSDEAHHSIAKAAKVIGLGQASVKSIPVDHNLKMNMEKLVSAIQQDIKEKNQPFSVVGTAGTTGAGAIDDLVSLRKIADDFNLWFHVDAAYGGGAVLNKELKPFLEGIGQSDSITCDAHKWMSVPMGTSMFLTSHREILGKTFRITTEYMPKETKEFEVADPYTHSIQWSRRSIGLRLYVSLQIFGWKGYEDVIGFQTKMGEYLRRKLVEHGWNIKNDTPLPIVCFTDSRLQNDENFTKSVLHNIINSGKSWISIYPIHGIATLRACITNYSTTEAEVEELVMELNKEREAYSKGK